ncbi:hypothetical protein CBOM_07541 [Ceraceosorus bombacis]|uniref:Uncharacterized protein n=1 Tax=Ceraceosorus bombacis TaxID=401625 RepID=A0A0N7L9Q8_9BASI|nr:hypothetical protein CBOM_07541 [Ceraceosorus bombacis]
MFGSTELPRTSGRINHDSDTRHSPTSSLKCNLAECAPLIHTEWSWTEMPCTRLAIGAVLRSATGRVHQAASAPLGTE